MRVRWASVSSAYLIAGLTMYALMAVAKGQLSSSEFDLFAVLWALGFAAAAVAAVPVEQELTRAVAVGVSLGLRPWRDVRKAYEIAVGLGLSVAAVAVAAMTVGVFGAEAERGGSIAVIFLLIVSECTVSASRGVLAGLGRTDSVAMLVVGQAVLRFACAAGVVLLGYGAVGTAGAVAAANVVVLGFLPFIRSASQRGLAEAKALSSGGIRRLAMSSPARALFAIGTPALAGAAAGPDDVGQVGDVLVALSLTSAPVLLAAAMQAVFLPGLATAVRSGRHDEVALFVRRSLLFNTGVGLLAALVAGTVGPKALSLLFGGASSVSAPALVAMTVGAALLFLANLLTSVLIARERHAAVALWWSAGAVVMLVAVTVQTPLGLRIGVSVLVGAATVACGLLASTARTPEQGAGGSLVESTVTDIGVAPFRRH